MPRVSGPRNFRQVAGVVKQPGGRRERLAAQLDGPAEAVIALHRAANPDGTFPTPEEWEAQVASEQALGSTWMWDYFPRRAPKGWAYVDRSINGVAARRADGLIVMASGNAHDGERWLHISVSRPKGLPSYYDLKAAKATFIGDRLFGYQVFAPPSKNVSVAEVLHIWACVDRPMVLPDFLNGWDII